MSKRLALHPATDLTLPIDTVTQTVGILAKKRMGKSYTARKLVEELLLAEQQTVVVDPKGDWWGLRSSADGRHPGFPVVILGGERGDVPLETGGGEVVAKLVAEERVSCLLDLSLLRKHEVATFMTAFLEALYRLKAREANRTPLMLVIDEADAVAPQKPQPNEARMLGACEDIVRRGGQRGIGCTMITQRSAVLSKNVLTQIQVLVALRTISPQDLKAVNEWVDVHGTDAQRKELMASLPSLPVGDAWWWSPGWPTQEGIFQRAKVDPIMTFDSGATPKVGERRAEPRHLADVDLEAVKRQMAETLERAKADDPRELRKRVAELEAELKGLREMESETISADVLRVFKEASEVLATARRCSADLAAGLQRYGDLDAAFERATKGRAFDAALTRGLTQAEAQIGALAEARWEQGKAIIKKARTDAANELSKCARALLEALAQRDGVTRCQLAVLSGYSASSSSFHNAISELRVAEMIVKTGDKIAGTDKGFAAVGGRNPSRSKEELRALWMGKKLSKAAKAMLGVLFKELSCAPSRLSERTGYSLTSSSFHNAISELNVCGLIHRTPGFVTLDQELQ